MDMIKLCYQCSSGTTPGLGPDKPAPGVSSATTAMTQMTARMVTSEAQPVLVRRDPATAPAAWAVSIRSPDHLLPSKQKPGGRCRPLMPMSGRALIGDAGDPQMPKIGVLDIAPAVLERSRRVV